MELNQGDLKMTKTAVSPDEYNKVMDLWKRACVYEGKDPGVKDALYIFDDNNPHYQEYIRYSNYLKTRNL